MSGERDPQLIWTETGEPRSGRFGDVYFSAEDGLAESRAVFLEGCGLPDAWAGRNRFTVAELGFGTGLNIVALLDLWSRTRDDGAHLHVFSIEGFPLRRDEATRALKRWPEVAALADRLMDRWPAPTPGFHRIDLPELAAVVDLAVGDVAWALDQWDSRADAWFLDGFAPSTNPGMWSDAVLNGIAARSAPGARLATFTVAGSVRRGLSERGFTVEKRPGHGRKRERLEARFAGSPGADIKAPRVAVIGAGIAGQSVARAVVAAGASPVVIEADRPGAGASGFPAALITPRLDAGDAGIAALYAQALERAGQLYDDLPGAVLHRGVLQLAATPRDPARFGKIAAQAWWDGAMTTSSDDEVHRRTAGVAEGPGLWMGSALTVRPEVVRDAWLAGVEVRPGRAVGLSRSDTGWTITCDDRTIIEAEAVVVTGGWGTATLLPDLALAPVAGQADWVDGVVPPAALAWGGYAVPTAAGMLWGATHDRGVTDLAPDDDASARNLAQLRSRLPQLAKRVTDRAVRRRTAVRATTPDRLPICGQAPGRPGLFVLGGLGSRGFCVAPLLGEHVAALALGLSSPLSRDLAARVDPGRPALGTRTPASD